MSDRKSDSFFQAGAMVETLSFGEWLRHRRRELDLTQAELGQQVGCARITIRKMEVNQMRPSRQLAELLGERLGISPAEREDFIRFARGGELMGPILTAIPKHNLPKPVSSFIGREHEIAEVKRLMKRSRLVTLTGAGGSGKTRLALQVADQALNQFSDGIYFVNFAPLSQSSLVQQTTASVLGVHEDPGYPLIQTLTDYLYSKSLLLLFDNCEHLLAECAQTAEQLLQACPQLSILVTSREALGIDGEEQYHVPTLSLPEAVHLFAERAEAVQSNFYLTDQNAAMAVQICQHLDGIPLALELAAALVKGLSVEQIVSRLDDRFHLLTSGYRTALPRQRTLQATIDWSYQLLSKEEQRVLRRLSVFAGDWTLSAAEFVCAGDDLASNRIMELQLRIIDKSLVIAETEEIEPRYHMLETIREYAMEKLEESGEARQGRMRHLNFFLTWAEQMEPEFRGGEYQQWLNCMDKERDNLRAALGYSIASDQSELALRLFGSTFWVWVVRGPWNEGQRWAETALAKASDKPAADRARVLIALGLLFILQTDLLEAHKRLEQSIAIWRRLEDEWSYAFAVSIFGFCLIRENQPVAANFLEEALHIARQVNDKWLLALCLHLRGEQKFYQGDLAGGRPLTEESLKLIHMLGDHMILCDVLCILGEMADSERDYTRALHIYEEALAVASTIKDIDTGANLKFDMGRVYQITGDNDQAARLFTETLQVSFQTGKKSTLTEALAGLGVVAHARGDSVRAVRLLQASQSLFDNLQKRVLGGQMVRNWLERNFAAVRAGLDEESFATLTKEGQAMSLEQAVQYGLEETKDD